MRRTALVMTATFDIENAVAGLAGPDHQDDALGTIADGADVVLGAGAGIVAGGLSGLVGLGGAVAGGCGHLGEAADHLMSWWSD